VDGPAIPDIPSEEAAQPDALFATLYGHLRLLASRERRRSARDTLDTTALVHELYLRIGNNEALAFAHRGQFLHYAVRALRHLLTDRAREKLALRAGGDWARVTLTGTGPAQIAIDSAERALVIDAALRKLEAADARAAHVVELRFFAGLSLEEIAAVIGLTRRTIDRDWTFARAFLKAEFDDPGL
jgi:RNA polymerase sigma factor (TIGR02999 family)